MPFIQNCEYSAKMCPLKICSKRKLDVAQRLSVTLSAGDVWVD